MKEKEPKNQKEWKRKRIRIGKNERENEWESERMK